MDIQKRVHPPVFKSKVALEAIKEQKTIAELASQFSVHPTQITKWKRQALEVIETMFAQGRIKVIQNHDDLIRSLYEQIGKLQVESDWLKKRLGLLKDEYNLNAGDLIKYINSKDVISIAKQAELLGVARSSFYYKPKGIDEFTFATMNEIDEVYTKRPYFGSRKIAKEIGRRWVVPVNRKRIQRLMREMGLEAIYPKPNLSRNGLSHPIYPYLLRGVKAGYPNHIWGTDITYIRLEKGFLYMAAFMDWFSRFILSWKLSTTLTTDFVVDAAKKALNVAHPDITNSDQGVQFTSHEYLDIWDKEKTKISMDGRGRAMDNIFTERFWRNLKYEDIYLKGYQTVKEAVEGIGSYVLDYNYDRIHESLGYKTPAEIYYGRR